MTRTNIIGCLFGRKGSGKSTLARDIVRWSDRVVILDYVAEYGPECRALPVEGYAACLDALRETQRARRYCLALRVESADDALRLLGVCYHLRDVLLVIEEASRYCDPVTLPASLERLIRYGRHRGISQLYIARRPAEVHRDITANADWVCSFRQWEPRDIVYLRALVGEQAETVRTLRAYRSLVVGDVATVPLPVLGAAQVLVDTAPPAARDSRECGEHARTPPM